MAIDLAKVGTILKEQRVIKGLSITDVSNSLCVRKSLISAVEEGNWSVLPHEVYVRGYLKEYAHLLGCYELISNDLSTSQEPVSKTEQTDRIKKSDVVRGSRLPKRAIIYPLGFVLIAGVLVLSQIYKNPTEKPHVTEKGTEVVSALSNVNVNIKNEGQPVPEIPNEKKLMITCNERTWISVVIDDLEKKEFMLNPHDIVVLNAKNTFDLLIGNAAGVRLVMDGNDVELSGASGEVKRLKLS